MKIGKISALPLTDSVAAVSCGLYQGAPVLDLDYAEDSNAEADANFVLTGKGGIVEIQATAEQSAFAEEPFQDMLRLARLGIAKLMDMQRQALEQA